eukprot:Skav222823  [mRNA]  locus=scaffold4760:30468:32683:- [translate_table: standard]
MRVSTVHTGLVLLEFSCCQRHVHQPLLSDVEETAAFPSFHRLCNQHAELLATQVRAATIEFGLLLQGGDAEQSRTHLAQQFQEEIVACVLANQDHGFSQASVSQIGRQVVQLGGVLFRAIQGAVLIHGLSHVSHGHFQVGVCLERPVVFPLCHFLM